MVITAEKWAIDLSHSKIGFSVRHFGITETEGFFKKATTSITAGSSDFSDAEIEVVIDANSISTNDEQRDAHLKNADFFDVEKYPMITFKSHRIERIDDGKFELQGNLSIRDVTKPVKLQMEFIGIVPKDPYGNTKAGLVVQGEINRKDFGLLWNVALDHGGLAVSNTVKIFCPVQLLKM